MKLKYLLAVKFEDGTMWNQEPDDVSHIDPKRSHYYDLLQINKKMVAACLIEDGVGPALAVDLKTGMFAANGLDFCVGQNLIPAQRELVFFREHQHDMVNTYETSTQELIDQQEGGHRVKYYLGWKANIGGKEDQQIVGID